MWLSMLRVIGNALQIGENRRKYVNEINKIVVTSISLTERLAQQNSNQPVCLDM